MEGGCEAGKIFLVYSCFIAMKCGRAVEVEEAVSMCCSSVFTNSIFYSL
jgi:hypothetical protein